MHIWARTYHHDKSVAISQAPFASIGQMENLCHFTVSPRSRIGFCSSLDMSASSCFVIAIFDGIQIAADRGWRRLGSFFSFPHSIAKSIQVKQTNVASVCVRVCVCVCIVYVFAILCRSTEHWMLCCFQNHSTGAIKLHSHSTLAYSVLPMQTLCDI